ncbi:MAG TPA: type II toxin-antitoxin system HipA family toxin [Solirubrobacterales bacterium]
MNSHAEVHLWGRQIGAVTLADASAAASFEYEPSFLASGIEVAPIEMPLAAGPVFRFPALARESFSGLPGLLADSLPDRYGNALINAWLATRGRRPKSFDAVERLSYVGQRGMGALEFRPARGPKPSTSHKIDVEALVELAGEVLANREGLATSLQREGRREALREILRVGASAGGARAKALIAFDSGTEEVRSGQLEADARFEYWILKFDGVEDGTRDLGNSRGYGVVEWVYSKLASRAGIEMSECRLLEEGGRSHFMTRRFDRGPSGTKIHMQSLAALAHLDFNQAGAHSYEQAFQTIRELGLPHEASVQQFRRMVFNIVARNQDDHVKNIAFLMDRRGRWSLSPAFDVVYAHNPEGSQTRWHQMSLGGKRDDFTVEDLRRVGELAALKRGQAEEILAEVTAAVEAWPQLARDAGLDKPRIERIRRDHRLRLPKR